MKKLFILIALFVSSLTLAQSGLDEEYTVKYTRGNEVFVYNDLNKQEYINTLQDLKEYSYQDYENGAMEYINFYNTLVFINNELKKFNLKLI